MTDTTQAPCTETIIRPTQRTINKGRDAVTKNTIALKELKVEYVNPDTLYPNTYNPNRQSEREFEMLKMSMLDDGFTQPILVHKNTRMIIDGEHRWRAATQLGFKEVPVVFTEMTLEQMKISTLRHNRARGNEDIELTLDLLRDLRELGGLEKAVEGLLIDDTELQAMLDGIPSPDIMAKENFSTAWVPQENADRPEVVASDRRISMTDASIQKIHEYERYIDEAEDEDNRELRRQELGKQILKITATWSIKEAKKIRKILGDRPANKLVNMCAHYAMKHQTDYTEDVVDIAREICMKTP